MDGIRINRATRDVIERKPYPNAYGEPITGYGFNDTGEEEWLIIVNDTYNDTFDSRYYQLVSSEDEPADRIEHPSYPGVGQWVKHYRKEKLPLEQQLINLENAENMANELIMPSRKQFKFLIVTMAAIAKKVINNVTPTAEEITAATYVIRAANKIVQNYLIRKGKEADIDLEPDMDSDWITEFEDE